jgi:hypothetical protein
MITEPEADFFARCAEMSSPLEGAIVDLGCWMGSTAVALAKGAHRGGRGDRVRAFDIFVWEDWMNESHAKLVSGIYQQGESFLPEARRIVHEHGHGLVDLVAADLTEYQWSGEPIKLLLVDAMKSMSLMQQIATTFFPCVPAGGFMLHQDFKHCYTSWIHILHYRLRHHFELVESVVPGGTVGFRVVEPISLDEVAAAIDFDGITEAEGDAAFEHSLSLLDPSDRKDVAEAHISHFWRLNDTGKVLRLAEHYAAQGIDVLSEHPLAGQALQLLAAQAA